MPSKRHAAFPAQTTAAHALEPNDCFQVAIRRPAFLAFRKTGIHFLAIMP
jgi:hypothetical protein